VEHGWRSECAKQNNPRINRNLGLYDEENAEPTKFLDISGLHFDGKMLT